MGDGDGRTSHAERGGGSLRACGRGFARRQAAAFRVFLRADRGQLLQILLELLHLRNLTMNLGRLLRQHVDVVLQFFNSSILAC